MSSAYKSWFNQPGAQSSQPAPSLNQSNTNKNSGSATTEVTSKVTEPAGPSKRIQFLKNLYAAFEKGDLQFITQSFHTDFVFIEGEPEGNTKDRLPWSGLWKGPEGFAASMGIQQSLINIGPFKNIEFFENEASVIAKGSVTCTGINTGRNGTFECVHVFKFSEDNSQIIYFREHVDTQLLAALLPETVAVIGANGQSGSAVVKHLLSRAYPVIAIVRDASKLPEDLAANPLIQVRVGDILSGDGSDIKSLVEGADVVVSTYSPGFTDVDPLLKATKNLIQHIDPLKQRLFAIGGAGGLKVADGSLVINQSWFPEAWKPIAQAHIDALSLYRESRINFTVLTPPGNLYKGEGLGCYRVGLEEMLFANGEAKISYDDLGLALVDEIKNKKFIRTRFTAAY